jgi:dihydroorotate dehydrogenase (NAD+) catalytic subunit
MRVPHDGPLVTTLAGISLRSPVIAAAGTCGYTGELAQVADVALLGAITTKSITAEPREGNDPVRIVPTRVGMLNAIGLANMGLAAFLEREVPRVRSVPTRVIASVAGHSAAEFVAVARALDSTGEFPALELNVSCPNTQTGRAFAADSKALHDLVAEVRSVVTRSRLFVKLPPDMGDSCAMALAAITAGADALTLCNTLPGMAIDPRTRRMRLSRGVGGISGPGIHPLIVRVVREVFTGVARERGIPIVALGGVTHWEDAAEFVLAGATAVAVGTALLADPRIGGRIARGLDAWVMEQGCERVGQLVGQAQP